MNRTRIRLRQGSVRMRGCPHGRWVRCAWSLIPTSSSSGRRRRSSSTSSRRQRRSGGCASDARRLRSRLLVTRRGAGLDVAARHRRRRRRLDQRPGIVDLTLVAHEFGATRRRGRCSRPMSSRPRCRRDAAHPTRDRRLLSGDAIASWALRAGARTTAWGESTSRSVSQASSRARTGSRLRSSRRRAAATSS